MCMLEMQWQILICTISISLYASSWCTLPSLLISWMQSCGIFEAAFACEKWSEDNSCTEKCFPLIKFFIRLLQSAFYIIHNRLAMFCCLPIHVDGTDVNRCIVGAHIWQQIIHDSKWRVKPSLCLLPYGM